MDYTKHIVIDSSVRFGRPCIKGTRISVYDILSLLANGMSPEELIVDFPELKIEDIRAALAYSADREHKTRVA